MCVTMGRALVQRGSDMSVLRQLGIAQRYARRTALVGGAAMLTTQAAFAAVLMVDQARKRRSAPPGGYPKVAPHAVQVAASQVTTYMDGVTLYDAMITAIRHAEKAIYFETFIWKNDQVGQRFKTELLAAAQRGVQVFIVYDQFANLVVDGGFKRFPPWVHVLCFPLFRGIPTLRSSGRDHRKILVVDDEIGFVGGYNIGDLYESSWRDTHLRIVGPAASDLSRAFADFWNHYRKTHHPRVTTDYPPSWEARMRTVRNIPSRMSFPIRTTYLDAINRSRISLYMTHAYFLPDEDLIHEIVAASQRGVDVQIVLPRNSNHVVADWVSRSVYTQLLEEGVRIWLYEGVMVHAKTAVIDGRWATVGTANIDRLSLLGNYEINMEVYDFELAAHLEEIFAVDITNCTELTMSQWSRRSLRSRIGERILSPLQPLL